jgi:hypothetical protein
MPLWPAKKDQKEDRVQIAIPELPQPAGAEADGGGEAPDELGELCARLGQIGDLLGQAHQRLLAYLSDRQSQRSAAMADGRAAALADKIDGLAERLGRLDAQLQSFAQKAPGGNAQDTSAAALAAFCDGLNRQFAALADRLRQLQERLDAGLERLAERLAPEVPGQPAEPAPAAVCGPVIGPPAGDDWQRALLGSDLAERPGLDFQRQQLLAGVAQGDPGACSLLGQLLIFRSAPADKMPPLLKDIGEAYYRWQPKTRPGPNPLEKALAAWLRETMQDVGIANTVELVEPGERFDSTRHTASTRGVEITEVRGWVVLREGGKVYTKANVAVR